MLGLMRKHAGNWMIKILLGAIAVAFALSWGVYNYGNESRQIAVKVNDQPILLDQVQEEYARLSERARQQFGKQFEQVAPFLNLRNRATDSLIDQVLLAQAASSLHIEVSRAEVAARVASTPAFQRDGRFDIDLYRRLLANNHLTPETYEAMQAEDIRLSRLSALVAGSAQVTPLEVEQALTRELSQVRGMYVLFTPAEFESKIEVTDQMAKDFYQTHLNMYMEPEKISLDYLVFPLADQRDKVQVMDNEVEEAYDRDIDKYRRPEEVRARHILLKLPENAAPAEVDKARAKAQEILAEAKKPGADFAELARRYSQGPTADKGGDLGYFPRGVMVGPFEQLAFSLKPGEMAVVRTPFGFHVVKVEDKKPASQTPLDEVRGKIKAALVERIARDQAQAAAERAFDALVKGATLDMLAQEKKQKVQTTPLFAQGEKIEGLSGAEGIFAAAHDLAEGQPVPAVPYEAGSVLAVIKKRVPAQPKPFKEVAEQARLAVREREATKMAERTAQGLVDQLTAAPDPLAKLKESSDAKETKWLGGQGMIEGLDGSQGLIQALFMQPDKPPVVPRPVVVGGGFAAVALAERRPPTAEEMDKRRPGYAKELLAAKQRRVVNLYLEDLRAAADILVPVNKVGGSFKLPGCDAGTTTVWVPRNPSQQ